jgi:cyclopropane-fatty-acyl-phospholipid synthase
MKTQSIDAPGLLAAPPKIGLIDRVARRLVLKRLGKLHHGRVALVENENQVVFGAPTEAFAFEAEIEVIDPRFYSEVAFGGSIGSGEAYMQGYWRCEDLTSLVRILLRNRDVLEGMETGIARLAKPVRKLLHWLNRNTRKGSRKNIAAHYDLGNDFYSLWLDETMMYSSAFFPSRDATLKEASVAKLDRICRKLDLQPTDTVVEIGTGWGGFALHAAKNYGCHVTTTTISRQQYDFALERIRSEGLEDRITLLFEDYRDLEGSFDKLVSIEMIEAVGHEFHDTYFAKCAELLKPSGQMLLQAITIDDRRYEAYKKGVDFIKRYIFPGGCLTSVTAMTDTLTRVSDMRVFHIEDIGPHYARTLRRWHERFMDRIDEVSRLGYSEAFQRMWRFYLSYCEGAFREHAIGNVQMLMVKPEARPETIRL